MDPHQVAGPGKEVSEKSLELNVCAELLQRIRTVPGCEGALWLGLTQRQERRKGLDEFIHNVGPGMALMLQFKAPWRTSVEHRYKFSINERQHEALEDLAAHYPQAVHYVFPFFSTWSKAKEYAPDLVRDTWFVPTSSVPLATLQAASSPKTGRHRVELERTGPEVVVTVHSPRVVGEAINAGEFLAELIAQTTSGTLSRPLVPHGRLQDWTRTWDTDGRAARLPTDELASGAAVSSGRVRFTGLSALYIPSSTSNA